MSKKKVLSKFTILCWAAFTAILGRMQPKGRRLDTPVSRLRLQFKYIQRPRENGYFKYMQDFRTKSIYQWTGCTMESPSLQNFKNCYS